MKFSTWLLPAPLVVAVSCSGAGQAQTTQGLMGSESRATIGIKVSVMPKFALAPAGTEPTKGAQAVSASALDVSSNVSSSVGFRLVAVPYSARANQIDPETGRDVSGELPASPPEPARAEQPMLFLVVPD